MNEIPVFYHLKIGQKKFLKTIFVRLIPVKGDYLKIANHSFIVREREQDLDAYLCSDLILMPCESIKAELNPECHNEEDYQKAIQGIKFDDWTEVL